MYCLFFGCFGVFFALRYIFCWPELLRRVDILKDLDLLTLAGFSALAAAVPPSMLPPKISFFAMSPLNAEGKS